MPANADRPYSPTDGVWIKDDFIANDLVSDNNIGELKWIITNIANASTFSYLTQLPYGVLRSTTNGTAQGDGGALHTFTDGLVLQGTQGGLAFRFRYPTVAGNILATNNFYIGVTDSVTATAPGVGICLQSLAGVLTLRVDSADHGDTSQAITGVSTLTSGTTAIIDTWHTCLITWVGTNGQGGPRYVECWIDGEKGASVFCNIDNDEEVEAKITHWQTAVGGDTLELDIDYFEFWQYNLGTAGNR